jgi:hypothetical protein
MKELSIYTTSTFSIIGMGLVACKTIGITLSASKLIFIIVKKKKFYY